MQSAIAGLARRPRWYALESRLFINTDLLRFVAAAGVVIYHLYRYVAPALPANNLIDVSLHQLQSFVDVFFVLSGIVLHTLYGSKLTNARSYADFLRKRWARLAPLHYMTFFLYVMLMIAALAKHVPISRQNYDLRCLPAQLTLTQAWGFCQTISFNGPSWSISAEAGAYLLTPLIFSLAIKRWSLLVIVAGLAVASPLLPDGRALIMRTADLGLLRALAGFCLGTWLSAARGDLWARWLSLVPPSIAYIAFLLSTVVLHGSVFHLFCSYALAATIFARDLAGRVSHLTVSLAPLGKLTYSIYMLQGPVITCFIEFIAIRTLHLKVAGVAVLAILSGAIILPMFAVCSLLFFEMPTRCFIAGPSKRRTGAELAENIGP